MEATADQMLLDASTAADALGDARVAGGAPAPAFGDKRAAAGEKARPSLGVALNAAGALRRFALRHTWRPLPSAAAGLSASVGVRYDPDLQRRGGGGILRQLGLPSRGGGGGGGGGGGDGAELTAALVWRSADGLARLSVSDAAATARRGVRFSAGPVTGVLAAEVRYPLLGFASARRDPLSGAALPAGAPDPPRVLVPGGAPADGRHQRRAPQVSFSLDDVRPRWTYAAAVGAAVLLGAPVSLRGKEATVGLPGGGALGLGLALPRRLAAYARGGARHRGWLSYSVDVDELGGALEVGPLLRLGGRAAAQAAAAS